MARPINAALFVSAFTPTGNPGEYTFESALFNNQADRTGNGAYDVQPGFALYVPATDLNTGMQIPGAVHRYTLTSVTPIDPMTLSGTMVWGEPGSEEFEVPTNGVGCLLAQVSPNQHLGFLPSDSVYTTDLSPGVTLEAALVDTWNIVDAISGGSGPSVGSYKATIGDGVTTEFTLTHLLNTLDVRVELFELSTGATVYCGVSRGSVSTVTLSFTEPPGASDCRVLVTPVL